MNIEERICFGKRSVASHFYFQGAEMNVTYERVLPQTLDEKGRCCGRKPIVYKSGAFTRTGPHRFCPRCDRAYHLTENRQIANFSYQPAADGQMWERGYFE